ncbi:rRNA methyltransferase 3, mitochondrial isoform X1 [Dermacentor variabilis]|uniref:rRNA methyltransferase 3, mitochondrial isoform X1 n=1 Tax=Dermacentor variabilis TaxID=34621 RepID=UPI003F5C6B78
MGSLGRSASTFITICTHVRSGMSVQSVRFRRKGFVRTAQKVIYPTSKTEDTSKPASDPICGPRYVKLGSDDDEFANTMMQLKMKRRREKLNKVLLEGKRLIADALKAGVECESIYFTLPENIEGLPLETLREDQIKKVFYKKMKIWSDMTTCPGIMGVFKKPSVDQIEIQRTGDTIPVSVILDNVRDPGNMGTLIRTAAAAGCSQLLLSKGCVDPWELKVVRAGAGSHFRIPIYSGIAWEHMPSYVTPETPVYLADHRSVETVGARRPSTDSDTELNEEASDSEEEEDDDEESRYRIQTADGRRLTVDKSYRDMDELEDCMDIGVPHYEYTSARYANVPSVLVVGGETQGLSLQAHKLAVECVGARVHVPANNGVDSLNTAIAASIILYEMRRQMLFSSSGSNNNSKEEEMNSSRSAHGHL